MSGTLEPASFKPQALTQREHVLGRPELYAGDTPGVRPHVGWVPLHVPAPPPAAPRRRKEASTTAAVAHKDDVEDTVASPDGDSDADAGADAEAEADADADADADDDGDIARIKSASLAGAAAVATDAKTEGTPRTQQPRRAAHPKRERLVTTFAWRTDVQYAGILLKMVDEVLVNVYDAAVKALMSGGTPVTRVDVRVDAATGRITARNNGGGVPVVKMDVEGTETWAPSALFGRMLASTNFGDIKELGGSGAPRESGGVNGIGIKLVNVLSREFTVAATDAKNMRAFKQTWRNNMADAGAASVREIKPRKKAPAGYTEISFVPDLLRLGYDTAAPVLAAAPVRRPAPRAKAAAPKPPPSLARAIHRLVDSDAESSDSSSISSSGSSSDSDSSGSSSDSDSSSSGSESDSESDAADASVHSAAVGDSTARRIQVIPFVAPPPAVLPPDTMLALERRVWELAASLSGGPEGAPRATVFYNGRPLAVRSWSAWAAQHLPPARPVAAADVEGGWRVAVATRPPSAPKGAGFAMVNGIPTPLGGAHVDAVVRQLAARLADAAAVAYSKAVKKGTAKPPTLRAVMSELVLFVSARVKNPAFGSQAKESLRGSAADLAKTAPLPPKLLDTVASARFGAVAALVRGMMGADDSTAAKTDGAAGARVVRVAKLDDAPAAGTRRAADARLFLTEGDSAKATVLSALAELPPEERALYGVYPLKGKVLNVRDASLTAIHANAEVADLKAAMGLRVDEDGADVRTRYGGIIIATDADADGAHITGLIVNVFATQWPRLAARPGFFSLFLTPILRLVAPPRTPFYTKAEFEAWVAARRAAGQAVPAAKHFKGLGTSTPAEAREYMSTLRRLLPLEWDAPSAASLAAPSILPPSLLGYGADRAMHLAFSKSAVEARKAWMVAFDPRRDALPAALPPRFPLSSYVGTAIATYSDESLKRAMPSVLDGLTPSQRKVLFYLFFKRGGGNGEIKVAALAGAVIEGAGYEHGDASLCQTIVRMAQDFVGRGGCPLLSPNGQFGTRLEGGGDAASPRYIFTKLSPLARALFPAADDALLERVNDEGVDLEPRAFLPVLPTLLLNGADGGGTGFNTSVPCYNPLDVLARVRARLRGEADGADAWAPQPWYRGFRGTIAPRAGGGGFYDVGGALEVEDAAGEDGAGRVALVTELPLGKWTSAARAHLDDNKLVSAVASLGTAAAVRLRVTFNKDAPPKTAAQAADALKAVLHSSLSTRSMHAYAADHVTLTRYASPHEIMEAWLPWRAQGYADRAAALLAAARAAAAKARAIAAFIDAVIDGRLSLLGTARAAVLSAAAALGIPTVDGGHDFLLRLHADAFTAEAAAKHRAAAGDADAAAAAVEGSDVAALWHADLDAFEAAYGAWLAAWEAGDAAARGEGGGGKAGKAAGVARKRKAAAGAGAVAGAVAADAAAPKKARVVAVVEDDD